MTPANQELLRIGPILQAVLGEYTLLPFTEERIEHIEMVLDAAVQEFWACPEEPPPVSRVYFEPSNKSYYAHFEGREYH